LAPVTSIVSNELDRAVKIRQTLGLQFIFLPDCFLSTLCIPCRLFEIAPELQELFPFQGQELNEENTLLKKHALQVMESVGLAISLMGDPEQLQETLIELGIIHNMKSVQVKSFEVCLMC